VIFLENAVLLFHEVQTFLKMLDYTTAASTASFFFICLSASNWHFFSLSHRILRLLGPAKLTAAIRVVFQTALVRDVNIVKIHRCGDGLASTTDRIVLDVSYCESSPHPPSRILAKVILLHGIMRMGASESIIKLSGKLARYFESSQYSLLRSLASSVWSSMVLYQRYFPHAPDAMYRTESRVYSQLHSEFKSNAIHTPDCYGVFNDERTSTFGVLLEDLSLRGSRGVAFPNALSTLTIPEIKSILSNLARLHSRYWNSPRLKESGDLAWLPTHLSGGMQPVFHAIGLGLITDQVRRHSFKADLIAPLNRSVKDLYRAVEVCQLLLSSDPPTVLHGDCHVANTFLYHPKTSNDLTNSQADQIQGGLFDFQLSLQGSFMHDVAYIIITSLHTSVRREEERELIRYYLTELKT
jgi:hypothetical protein